MPVKCDYLLYFEVLLLALDILVFYDCNEALLSIDSLRSYWFIEVIVIYELFLNPL